MQGHAAERILFLAGGLFVLMGLEYGLLWMPEAYPSWAFPFFQRFGTAIRVLAPLFYVLYWMVQRSDPTSRKPRPIQAPSLTLLSVLGFFGGMAGLYLSPTLFGMPIGTLMVLLGGYGISNGIHTRPSWGLVNPRKKETAPWGFNLRLKDGWVNIVNPFRGILVIGAAGSGKSHSIAEPLLEQAAAKGYTGIVYDFKFPTLCNCLYASLKPQGKAVRLRVVNFKDLSRSHRLNPLKPQNLPMVAYAEEYAQAVIANLRPDTISKKDYWINSATKVFSATIWYLKKHHPAYCTLPHVVALICHRRFQSLLTLLEQDLETAPLIADMSVAVELGAEKQVAGVIGTLQNALSALNTPEIFWVLSGDDFDLTLNDPDAPQFLCLGTDPSLSQTFAPVVACIITVALKHMNQAGKHPSIVLLDEAPTLYIPRFDQIPATARSNRIATVYMAQDISQMVQSYGEVNAEVITGNLNNQFFGKVANQRTANYVAKMIGREEKEVLSFGENISGRGMGMMSYESQGRNVNHSLQERDIVRPQEVMNQQVGAFTGLTVGPKGNQWFKGQIIRKASEAPSPLPPFATGVNAPANFERIHKEAQALLQNVSLYL